MALAASMTLTAEKWQLTTAGRVAQPRPIVSVNPLTEVSVTLTVALWPVGMETEEGVTVMRKPTGTPVT